MHAKSPDLERRSRNYAMERPSQLFLEEFFKKSELSSHTIRTTLYLQTLERDLPLPQGPERHESPQLERFHIFLKNGNLLAPHPRASSGRRFCPPGCAPAQPLMSRGESQHFIHKSNTVVRNRSEHPFASQTFVLRTRERPSRDVAQRIWCCGCFSSHALPFSGVATDESPLTIAFYDDGGTCSLTREETPRIGENSHQRVRTKASCFCVRERCFRRIEQLSHVEVCSGTACTGRSSQIASNVHA